MGTKNSTPDHYSIVAKDNSMVEHLAGFQLNELRLIAYCLAHYDSTKPENRTFTAKVSDLRELFPIDKKEAYNVVKDAMLGINQKPLQFEENNKKHFWNWFSGFTYDKGTGEFEFRITPEIRPYILGLKNTFTKYRLGAVYQFKSAHTWKLYENLKKEAFRGQWSIGLDELKILLGVAGKYKVAYEFDRWIISPAVSELNEKSDLEVSYEKRKRGRSVVGLIFQIQEKPPEDTINVKTSKQELARLLAMAGIHQKTIERYVDMAEKRDKVERCVNQFPKIMERSKDKSQDERKKYILGALKNEIQQLTLFDEQPQRSTIDFDQYDDATIQMLAQAGNQFAAKVAQKRGL